MEFSLSQNDVLDVTGTEDEKERKASNIQQVCVMLPETDRRRAEKVLNRMRSLFADMRNLHTGLAVYPDDGKDARKLMDAAQGGAEHALLHEL